MSNLPKFGMLTNPTIDVLKEIKTIARLGFDYVEIGIEGPEGKPEILIEKRNRILKLLNENNLFAIGHTSWWVDLGTEYEPVRRGWLEECRKIIRISSELNLPFVNFHSTALGLYFQYERHKRVILNNWIESLRQLVRYSKKNKVDIILENLFEGYGVSSPKDFKYIIDQVPEVKVHLDIGHAFIQGGMKNIKEYINTFRNKIEHIHVSDNHGKSDEHLPIGKGKINYIAVIRMLKGIGYNKTITLEVFTSRKDVVKSREKIKKLWNRY